MIKPLHRKNKVEYGDFQTPLALASRICRFLLESGIHPEGIVEPTCGKGSFLLSALDCFAQTTCFRGFEINSSYLDGLQEDMDNALSPGRTVRLQQQDFFSYDWKCFFADLPQPFLVLGNPPWVTNTELSDLESDNLPEKTNFQNLNGFEAISGKSNFDISEWMLIHLLSAMQKRQGVLAMLCKTSVARKVLKHCWNHGIFIKEASIYTIDAKKHFNVNVDACLFVCEIAKSKSGEICTVHTGLNKKSKLSSFGILNGELIADIQKYEKLSFLDGSSSYQWRSGVKHDCSKVMELEAGSGCFINGLKEECDIESDLIYPLFKSSDVFKGVKSPRKYVVLTQRKVGQDTNIIRHDIPKTWRYLMDHAALLDRRKSRIYQKNPRFSIFGIGDYSFAPYKIAISGLYKQIRFSLLPPYEGKPCMVDDTCYFISCWTLEEAELLFELCCSSQAKEFFESFIFWDAKRPVTADVLRHLDFRELAKQCDKEYLYNSYQSNRETQMAFSF